MCAYANFLVVSKLAERDDMRCLVKIAEAWEAKTIWKYILIGALDS